MAPAGFEVAPRPVGGAVWRSSAARACLYRNAGEARLQWSSPTLLREAQCARRHARFAASYALHCCRRASCSMPLAMLWSSAASPTGRVKRPFQPQRTAARPPSTRNSDTRATENTIGRVGRVCMLQVARRSRRGRARGTSWAATRRELQRGGWIECKMHGPSCSWVAYKRWGFKSTTSYRRSGYNGAGRRPACQLASSHCSLLTLLCGHGGAKAKRGTGRL